MAIRKTVGLDKDQGWTNVGDKVGNYIRMGAISRYGGTKNNGRLTKDLSIVAAASILGISAYALKKRYENIKYTLPKAYDGKDFWLIASYKNQRIALVDAWVARRYGYDARVLENEKMFEVWIHKRN